MFILLQLSKKKCLYYSYKLGQKKKTCGNIKLTIRYLEVEFSKLIYIFVILKLVLSYF